MKKVTELVQKRAKRAQNGLSMKLGDNKHSKLTELDFSGRFSFAQKRAKSVKNALKMTFLIISQNCAISFSDIFFV